MSDWIKTEDKMPDEDGCYFVYHKKCVKILSWNNHYKVWDDEEGDDYFCDAADGTHWIKLNWPSRPDDI